MDPRPVILVVDDQPRELGALLDALGRRFGADYRIVPYLSAADALAHVERAHDGGEEIALVIAEQWMAESTGIELLGRVRARDAGAKRALLVAWGDRRAAPTILQGCAFDDLDNYLIKPWEPAEVHLYPYVSEFLAEWTHAHRPPLELVRVIGAQPSPRTHELRELLERNGISHRFYDAASPEGARLLAEAGMTGAALPVVRLLDGRALAAPSNVEVVNALGVTSRGPKQCDLAIVGAGPAGLAAAVYGASEGLRTVVAEREAIGGQAGTSVKIRNFLGFPRGISGAELAQRAYQQAWVFGAKFVVAREVERLIVRGADRVLVLSDGTEITARAVIVATGASYRRLGVPGLERFVGMGVFYGAIIDPGLIAGRELVVVGGGNAAGQAAVHLAKQAARVTLLVRGDSLDRGMSRYLVRELEHARNVEVRLGTEVIDGRGDRTLEGITVRDRDGRADDLRADMLFVLIGATPRTDWLAGVVARDAHGFILTETDVARAAGWEATRPPARFETSVPGVFAIGDVRAGSIKRVAAAVGEGAAAVHYVHAYLAALAAAPTPAATEPDAISRAARGAPA